MTIGLHQLRWRRGFTLLEILIAVVIFALVLVAINGVFYGALRLRAKTSLALERSLPVQQILALIKHDLQGIVVPGGALGGMLTSDTAQSASISSLSSLTGLEFYTGTAVIDHTSPWANVQRVTYGLRPPEDPLAARGQDLVRLVTRNLLSTSQEEVVEQWLIGDVEQMQFSFYDGTGWVDYWDSSAEESVLPEAIKVEIAFAPRVDEDPRYVTPVQLVVPVFVQASTNQTQSTEGEE